MKKYLHILVAILLAGVAGIMVWFFINSNTPTEKVLVSTVKMSTGTVITQQHIQTKLIPKSVLPSNALTNPESVIGKTLSMPVLDGDVLRQDHLSQDKGSLLSVLATVAPGRVAVDLPNDAASGLRGLERGDIVNVYGEAPFVHEGQAATKIDLVAKDAIILHVPKGEDSGALIIALLPEEEIKLATTLAKEKNITVFLQQAKDEEQKPVQQQKPVEQQKPIVGPHQEEGAANAN